MVLAIGEPPARDAGHHEDGLTAYSLASGASDLEGALGELVAEAQTLSVAVPVSLALLPGG